jgi:hypothetical protein
MLNDSQTKDLVLYNAFDIKYSEEIESHLKACLGNDLRGTKIENNRIFLDGGAVTIVRWFVVKYLNGLESVMVAWRHHVADRGIIDEEFKFLYISNVIELEAFRKVSEFFFPALEDFITTNKRLRDGKGNVI